MFLFHYGERQMGGRRPELSTLPLNVLKRGPITYYSINFEQHKNFYDFFNSSMVDVFQTLFMKHLDQTLKKNFRAMQKQLINNGEKLFYKIREYG